MKEKLRYKIPIPKPDGVTLNRYKTLIQTLNEIFDELECLARFKKV